MRVEIENAAAGFSAAKVSLADSFTRWREGIITSSAVPSRYDDLACISAARIHLTKEIEPFRWDQGR
jgi:hypothetical protein